MARQFARLDLNIWDDPDFCALSERAQRLYFLLVSYRTTNNAGMLPVQPTRWARHSAGTAAEQLGAVMTELEAARFVVIDPVTEELLIRSFIVHDGLGNWKHRKGIESSIAKIESAHLRALAQSMYEKAQVNTGDDADSIPNGLATDCEPIGNPLPTDTPTSFILEPSSLSLHPSSLSLEPALNPQPPRTLESVPPLPDDDEGRNAKKIETIIDAIIGARSVHRRVGDPIAHLKACRANFAKQERLGLDMMLASRPHFLADDADVHTVAAFYLASQYSKGGAA